MKTVMLYHGSWLEIAVTDIRHSRSDLDFGCGFYTTPLYEQADWFSDKFYYSEEVQRTNI